MRSRGRASALCAALVAALVPARAPADWPLEPTGGDHPVGESLGGYLFSSFANRPYQHGGVDLLATPKYRATLDEENPEAPWVVARSSGRVEQIFDPPGGRYGSVVVVAPDGTEHRYVHLEADSVTQAVRQAYADEKVLPAGSRIAKVVRWDKGGVDPCEYHHLHYERAHLDRELFLNPLVEITPRVDSEPPVIHSIGLAEDESDPWRTMQPLGPKGCIPVRGRADVVVDVRDRDRAGSTHPGTRSILSYDLRWRACAEGEPECPWRETHRYDDLPFEWTSASAQNASTPALFSARSPWRTDPDYCTDRPIHHVVTNWVGGRPDPAGAWQPPRAGVYALSVRAEDAAGNSTTRTVRACFAPGRGRCSAELSIRDATTDDFVIPFAGSDWRASPDVETHPWTEDEGGPLRADAQNTVRVRHWNTGACSLPPGTSYDLCLAWVPAGEDAAHPAPAERVVGCSRVTTEREWPVGSARETLLVWVPTGLAGRTIGLVAWVEHPDDPVLDSASVRLDDNRARRDVPVETWEK